MCTLYTVHVEISWVYLREAQTFGSLIFVTCNSAVCTPLINMRGTHNFVSREQPTCEICKHLYTATCMVVCCASQVENDLRSLLAHSEISEGACPQTPLRCIGCGSPCLFTQELPVSIPSHSHRHMHRKMLFKDSIHIQLLLICI